MLNQDTYETIDAYLNGTLTGVELEVFKQKLQNDAGLLEEVHLIRNVDATLSEEVDLTFQQILESEAELFLSTIDWEEEKKAEKQPTLVTTPARKIGGWSRKWAIAASLTFLTISVLLLWQIQSNKATSNEELFAQYSDTYALSSNVRGNDDHTTDFQTGIQQYEAKDFGASTQTFESLVAVNEQDMSLAFCLANACFNQNPPQYDLARQQFQKIINNNSSIYVTKAKWYLALIWLRKGKLKETRSLLKEVEQSGDKFAKKAKKLLEEIK